MKRVLITGAGGYVGRALTVALGDKYRLRLFGKTPKPGGPGPEGHEFALGDIRNLDDVLRAARGMDGVIHLAALTTDRAGARDEEYFRTNTVGTFNVLEASAKCGVKKIVYASSVCAVGFRPESKLVLETDPCRPTDGMYGTSKYLSERLCECYGARHALAILCLRLAMVVPQHKLSPPLNPFASRWLGAVHIEDVVEAFRLALEVETVGFDVFHIAAEGPHSKFDTTKARSILGYRPKHDFAEYFRPGPLRLLRGLIVKAKEALQSL